MIAAGKTKFRVVVQLTEYPYLEGSFDNLRDAEECVKKLEKEADECMNMDGIMLQEVTQKGDVISSKYFDVS